MRLAVVDPPGFSPPSRPGGTRGLDLEEETIKILGPFVNDARLPSDFHSSGILGFSEP